jgi:hypothetical protein
MRKYSTGDRFSGMVKVTRKFYRPGRGAGQSACKEKSENVEKCRKCRICGSFYPQSESRFRMGTMWITVITFVRKAGFRRF